MRGKLITLEGIDGSGKSTVAEKLQKNPEIKAFKPVFTREPTRGTLTGNAVEKAIQSDTDQLAELFLFTADHVRSYQYCSMNKKQYKNCTHFSVCKKQNAG